MLSFRNIKISHKNSLVDEAIIASLAIDDKAESTGVVVFSNLHSLQAA